MSDATNLVATSLADTNTLEVLAPATNLVQQLTDVSPPVAMAIVLAVLYCFAVSQSKISRLVIDLLVVGGAAAIYPQLADPGKVGFAVHNPMAAEVVTGALIGTAAIVFSPLVRKVLVKVGALSEPQPKDTNETVPSPSPSKPPTP